MLITCISANHENLFVNLLLGVKLFDLTHNRTFGFFNVAYRKVFFKTSPDVS